MAFDTSRFLRIEKIKEEDRPRYLRERDIENVVALGMYICFSGLDAYIFGSAVNEKKPRKYNDIDILAVGKNPELTRNFAELFFDSRFDYFLLDNREFYVEEPIEKNNSIIEDRLLLIPRQGVLRRLFVPKATLDLSIITKANFRKLRTTNERFH
jgi:hypothetical protein